MENLESMLNGIEKDKSAKGLPSYLTAIPTVPGAGSPGWSSPVWPPSPNSGIPPDGQPPTPTIYQLPRSYPGLPGSISGASPTSPEGRPSIPESAQLNLKIPKREENVPSEKDPKASAAPPSSSRIELDFTSLLKDLQDTHNQLLSARPSSVAASDGDDYHVNVDDYHGSVEDEDDSANLSKEPSRKDIASPSESLSPSGDHGITSDNERYRNQYDEQSDNGSESEASDDSYDDRHYGQGDEAVQRRATWDLRSAVKPTTDWRQLKTRMGTLILVMGNLTEKTGLIRGYDIFS
ncbi:hypothetical protein BC829DRAFT_117553 [Chytridium lagenaria]|nr:hypothetical protein BC829DRAFT_117553 [Chytridium lagenaria]